MDTLRDTITFQKDTISLETIEYYKYMYNEHWLYVCYRQVGNEWVWDEDKLTEKEFRSKYPATTYRLLELQIVD